MFGITNSIIPPANQTPLNVWFQDACDYNFLKKRVLAGELQQLPAQDRLFLLAFIVRNGMLHKAVHENDDALAKALVEAGADMNAQDTDGCSILTTTKTPELFSWLLQRGAQFVEPGPGSMLRHVIGFIASYCTSNDQKNGWLSILPEILKSATLDQYCQLKEDHFKVLIDHAKKLPAIAEILIAVMRKLAAEKPNEALRIAIVMLGHNNRKEYWDGFLWLIKQGLIKDPLIEQILTDPEIVFWNSKNQEFLKSLNLIWKPSGDLALLTQQCGDLHSAVFYKSALGTTTLQQAALLFSHLKYLPDTENLDPQIKKRLVDHVQSLQQKEKNTIWLAVGEDPVSIHSEEMLQMKKIGLDPNWTDPKNNRNFLFTKRAWVLKYDGIYKLLDFNRHQIDAQGDNALEHHCRHLYRAGDCLNVLARMGLRLGDKFPNIEKCRQVFPHHPVLQAFLAASLLNPRKNLLYHLFRHIPDDQSKIFYQTVQQDPELQKILGKNQDCKDPKKSRFNEDRNEWRGKYQPADLPKLEAVKDKWEGEYILSLFGSYWAEHVPSEVVNLIPESPSASLVIGLIKKQHESKSPDEKPLRSQTLFRILSHDDLIYFNRYIFEHPEIMRMMVQDYMKVKKIYIQSGGGTLSTHAKFIEPLLKNMGKLLHVPRFTMDMPEWQQKIMKAFDEHVPPVPKETLDIPADAKVRLHGRTVVVDKGKECEGFKFLQKGEDYEYFAQEQSVSKALNEAAGYFKSRFIKPIGVYAIKKLPQALDKYKDKLTDGGPAYVFHYTAESGKFKYLQDLPAEQFAASREVCLHDATKLEKMGIYPDLGLYHNKQMGRLYVLLVDLLARLSRDHSEFSEFSPAGGAGRVEEPFAKMRYPNMTETGLTDHRDARRLNGWGEHGFMARDMHNLDKDKSGGVYFHQMEALSKGLLTDILVLAEQYMNDGALRWRDKPLMQKLGLDLAKGFAHKISTYSDQPYDKSLRSVLGNGIDWTLAATQIAFWVDTNPDDGYPAWLARGKVPEEIYEKGTEVIVDASKAKNFDPVNGTTTNGNLDIGLYNGPLALSEFEKALHLLFNPIALAEPLSPPPPPERHFYGFYGGWDLI